MVGVISNPDDKIYTEIGRKGTAEARIATKVFSASDPHLNML